MVSQAAVPALGKLKQLYQQSRLPSPSNIPLFRKDLECILPLTKS